MDFGPTEHEIVRSAWQHADLGGNDRGADLAWAAGFFDGEGHIAIHRARTNNKNSTSFSLSLNLAQVDPRPVIAFQQIVGGVGKIFPHRAGGLNSRPAVQWGAWGFVAAEVLLALRPYLRHKGEQAEIAIEFYDGKVRHRGTRATPEEELRGQTAARRLLEIRASFGRN